MNEIIPHKPGLSTKLAIFPFVLTFIPTLTLLCSVSRRLHFPGCLGSWLGHWETDWKHGGWQETKYPSPALLLKGVAPALTD